MSPSALAEYVLGGANKQFEEAAVYDRLQDAEHNRRNVVFAQRPEFSGFSGICEARTLSVSYSVGVAESGSHAASPVEPEKREDGLRFRIVGDSPGGHAGGGDARGWERACAATGPVLDKDDERGGRFFQLWYGTAGDVDFAVRALREAQAEAKSSRHVPECERDVFLDSDPMCSDPVGALLRLNWQRLEGLSIHADKATPTIRQLTFFFSRDRRETSRADHVHVEMTAIDDSGSPPRIESVKIAGVTYVD
jgi:hypothetical protein